MREAVWPMKVAAPVATTRAAWIMPCRFAAQGLPRDVVGAVTRDVGVGAVTRDMAHTCVGHTNPEI